MNSKLLQVWLESVNQPVVNEVTEMVQQLFMKISDNGNFSPEQCKEILTAIVTDAPNTSISRRAIGSTSSEATEPVVRGTDVGTKSHWLGRLHALLDTIGKLIYKLKCWYGYHDLEYFPAPPNYLTSRYFLPHKCKRTGCDYKHSGWPVPSIKNDPNRAKS